MRWWYRNRYDILNMLVVAVLLLLSLFLPSNSTADISSTAARLPYPPIDLVALDWRVEHDARTAETCSITSNDNTNRDMLTVGPTCRFNATLPMDYFGSHIAYHVSRQSSNFYTHLMLFNISFKIKMEKVGFDLMQSLVTHMNTLPFRQSAITLLLRNARFLNMEASLKNAQQDKHDETKMILDHSYVLGWYSNFFGQFEKHIQLSLNYQALEQGLERYVSNSNVSDADKQHAVEMFNLVKSTVHVTVEEASLSYLMQPNKMDLHSPALQTARQRQLEAIEEARQLRDTCELLGASCAVVLKRLQVEEGLYPGGSRDPSASPKSSTETAVDAVGDVQTSTTTTSSRAPLPRVFCGIFTTERNHDSKVRGIVETWGRKCTALLAFSTVDDASIPSIALPHLGEESYYNMWQKTRSIWMYIAKHYVEDYDWFLLGGDDMYYVMENLYAYLMSEEISRQDKQHIPLYLGKTLYEPGVVGMYETTPYNTGGPGYILNKAALIHLQNNIHLDHCSPFVFTSAEDVFIADCLQKSTPSVFPYNTHDALNRPRFFHYPAGFIYLYDAEGFDQFESHWYRKYDPQVPSREACCSETSIAFHFMDRMWALATNDFLYHCPKERIKQYFEENGDSFYEWKTKVIEITDINGSVQV